MRTKLRGLLGVCGLLLIVAVIATIAEAGHRLRVVERDCDTIGAVTASIVAPYQAERLRIVTGPSYSTQNYVQRITTPVVEEHCVDAVDTVVADPPIVEQQRQVTREYVTVPEVRQEVRQYITAPSRVLYSTAPVYHRQAVRLRVEAPAHHDVLQLNIHDRHAVRARVVQDHSRLAIRRERVVAPRSTTVTRQKIVQRN